MEKLPKRQVLVHDTTRETVLGEVDRIIFKVNEIIEVINSLEHDDPKMASIQNRGGSNARLGLQSIEIHPAKIQTKLIKNHRKEIKNGKNKRKA